MKLRVLTAAAAALLLLGAHRSPQSAVPSPVSTAVASIEPQPLDAHQIVEQMLARNASLVSYSARVHVNLRMLNFPFLAPVLNGTTYFKRPDNYEVVFDRVPGYAKGFERIFNDVGDPRRWEQDQNIRLVGTQVIEGRRFLVLNLTNKIHSDILDHTVAFVDPSTYELVRMEWHYTNGGSIVMTQQYRDQNGYSVVGAQHVVIDIPHVHAIGDSQFSTYQTNIAVDAAVFSKQ